MDSSSSTTARHGWPKSAPPKLCHEAPPQHQGQVQISGSGNTYRLPRHETSSNAVAEHMQVQRLPRHLVSTEIPKRHSNIPKITNQRTSLPVAGLSNANDCNRRAVLIATTYSGTRGIYRHSDSINHVLNLFRLLTVRLKFQKDNVWVLTDAPEKVVGCSVKLGATRRNILTSLKWLVKGSKSGDILFFGFSGLGATVTKPVGNKGESISEDCLLPSDYPASSPIPESELSSLFVRELHVNASLTVVLDSRDASKILRLPFIQSVHFFSKTKFVVTETLEDDQAYSEYREPRGIASALINNRAKMIYNEMRKKIATEERDILASAFSGSGKVVAFGYARVSDEGQAMQKFKPIPVGALTQAFVDYVSKCVTEEKEATYRSILTNIVLTVSSKRNSRLPQITSSHRLDVSTTPALLKKTKWQPGSSHF